MSEKKKMGCMIIAVIVILFVVFGGGGMVVYKRYNKLEKVINTKIQEIPEFSQKQLEERIAKELDLELPVEEPYMNKSEVEKAIKKELRTLALEVYTTKNLEKRIAVIKDKYNNLPSIGDKIEIKLKNGKTIKGKYNGITEEDGFEYAKIGKKSYKMFDIDPVYYWMFNDLVALDLQSNKVKKIRKEISEKRKAVIAVKHDEVEKKIYLANGYMKQGQKWVAVYDVFMDKYKKEKKKFEEEYRKKIVDIYEENKLFGIMKIDGVQDSIKNVNFKDLDIIKQIKGEEKPEEKKEDSKLKE